MQLVSHFAIHQTPLRCTKRYCNKINVNINYNVVEHINYVAFHVIAKEVYLVLVQNVTSKDISLPCPNFHIISNYHIWSLDSQCEQSVILGLNIKHKGHKGMLNIK